MCGDGGESHFTFLKDYPLLLWKGKIRLAVEATSKPINNESFVEKIGRRQKI